VTWSERLLLHLAAPLETPEDRLLARHLAEHAEAELVRVAGEAIVSERRIARTLAAIAAARRRT
jgi:RNA-binding protein YhbY